MMNLELLFEASLLVEDSVFYKIADRHARTTLAHHFRADASSYHVVDYDPGTGAVRSHEYASRASPTPRPGAAGRPGDCTATR